METVGQDLRYALRSLWKSPGFAVVSTLTLGLAIGVNTAIFSLVSVFVFADLPMRESETVAIVRGVNAALEIDQGSVSPADYLDLVERARSFESLSALTETQWVLTGGDRPQRVSGLQVTAGTSETWRLPPLLGRSFIEGEDRFGAEPVAMLTHGFWESEYGSRPGALGETIRLDGVEHTIVGILRPTFEAMLFSDARVVTPLILNRTEANRSVRYLFVTGRMAPGVSHAAATEEVRRIGQELASEYPAENAGWGLWSAPVMESLVDGDAGTILLLLQLAVGMVILIACANVANMLLARATARAPEIAVRAALGAGRARLSRQLLTESLVISMASAALGLAAAKGLIEALIRISAGTEEVFLLARMDWRVLTFTLVVSLVAPLVFGLFPALRASAVEPSGVLRAGRSSDGGRGGKRSRSVLVTAQVSLALTLMVVASLLTRTVVNLSTRPLGYDGKGLLTVSMSVPEANYPEPDARARFFAQAREAVAAVPTLGDTEMVSALPGVGFGRMRSFVVEGRELVEGLAAPSGLAVTVSPGLFDLLGLNIESGRGFGAEDGPESPPVTVVSRGLVTRYWPGQDPVGGRIRVSGEDAWLYVVGVVADVRSSSDSDQPAPNFYLPHAQDARAGMILVSRTNADPAVVSGAVRDAVASVDPELPVDGVRTLDQMRYEREATSFALLTLFVTFAAFALLMAAIGIYGVMSYSVSQRRKEIGVRMALGAESGAVRRMVVGQGVRMIAVGVAIGLLAAFGVSRLLGNLVFGISATDPLTFVGVPLLLALVALAANLVPAVRATRLDPATTLRSE
jgi:predicted permease